MSTAAGYPHGGVPRYRRHAHALIDRATCPMRVQSARFARSNPVIAMVLTDCSTVQETALLVVERGAAER